MPQQQQPQQPTVIMVERQQAAPQQVVGVAGGCPSCRVSCELHFHNLLV